MADPCNVTSERTMSVIGLEARNQAGSRSSKCFENENKATGSFGGSLILLVPGLARMGCCGCSDEGPTSKVGPVTPDSHFSNIDDQVFTKHRSCTDWFALVVLIALICVFGFLISIAFKKGDIYRVIYGYDDCANVCGRTTQRESDPVFACKGNDMTRYPYLLAEIDATGVKSRKCITNCSETPDHVIFLNRCIPKKYKETANSLIKLLGLQSFFHEASRDLTIVWRELLYLLAIALAISLVILIAFRYIVQWIIYIVLVGVVVVCISGTTFLWWSWYDENKKVGAGIIDEEDASVQSYLVYAILMSIVTVITVLIVLVMRTRIALVIQLFREAGKAVYAMPALLMQPIYTYAMVGATFALWIYFMLWIESAGDLYVNKKQHIHYKKDVLLKVTRWYNIFLFFVMNEFYLGCQHMVVAGAVARWFFKRNKSQLYLAVTKSTWTTIRYHLGTVAFGAMIIGVVRLVRAILAAIQNFLKKYDNSVVTAILWCCQCCLACFETTLRFLGRNAYIETAIYGCNFCSGGKKAFQALSNNILRVAAINSVGDFVLFLGKVLVVTLTVVAGIHMMQKKEGIQHPWVPILLAGMFAFLVAHCFISIYEMIIDTIFICFCEDCAKNDGISKPFFMSKGLMEFVENSKKVLNHLDQQQMT